MTGTKYIGMDVHKESISICSEELESARWRWNAVIRDQGEHHFAVHRRAAREMCASAFEEGTWAAWLYELDEAARDGSR